MPGSDATSASADSSGASSSPPDSSAADGLRVDFYVLEEPSAQGRLRLACRLAEKAYLASQSVLLWHSDPAELRTLDELLWTFMDGSFVPHEVLGPATEPTGSPVLLSAGQPPPAPVDIIINLAAQIPTCLQRTSRVAEIIDGDETRRRAGRARFKQYREMGVQPASHPLRAEQAS